MQTHINTFNAHGRASMITFTSVVVVGGGVVISAGLGKTSVRAIFFESLHQGAEGKGSHLANQRVEKL